MQYPKINSSLISYHLRLGLTDKDTHIQTQYDICPGEKLQINFSEFRAENITTNIMGIYLI